MAKAKATSTKGKTTAAKGKTTAKPKATAAKGKTTAKPKETQTNQVAEKTDPVVTFDQKVAAASDMQTLFDLQKNPPAEGPLFEMSEGVLLFNGEAITEEALDIQLKGIVGLIDPKDINPPAGETGLKDETLQTLLDMGFTLPAERKVKGSKPATKPSGKASTTEKSAYGHRLGTMAADIDAYVKEKMDAKAEEISREDCSKVSGVKIEKVRVHLPYLKKKFDLVFKITD